jgi:NTP pyrophosphatase (non-canonical NTP hydrolase)
MTTDSFIAHASGEVLPVPDLDDTAEFAPYPPAPLTANEYQREAMKTAVYPGRGTMLGLSYVTLGLTGEAGELANQVKKALRDDDCQLTPSRRAAILDEISDCLWYAAAACDEIGANLDAVMRANLVKLQTRQANHTLKGDKRGAK